MTKTERVGAIALKEWRLNLRFPTEYFAANLFGPVKSALLMCLIYGGFLRSEGSHFGMVAHDNYALYVIVGTTCHSLLSNCVYVLVSKLVTEKWWQTVVATLISPASALELVLGFLIGSGGLHVAFATAITLIITLFHPISWSALLMVLYMMFLLSLLGFGVGLFGAMLNLCFEGKAFLFDYCVQGIIFMSCFYYPIELLPHALRGIPHFLPTYYMGVVVHDCFLSGYSPSFLAVAGGLTVFCVLILGLSTLLFDYAVRKFGIVGY